VSVPPNGEPLFSVVIAARNAGAFLGEQLEALTRQTYPSPFEVIVVDNASTDETAAVARAYAGRLDLRVLSADKRPSSTYARNAGARAATGAVIVFLDADDVADEGLLAAYSAQLEGHDILGGATEEKLLNDPEIASWRYELGVGALPVAFRRFTFFLMGNCAIRRSLFESMGGLDESFAHGGEEVEFSIRAALAGIEITWVPDAIIHYRHRTTLSGLRHQSFVNGRGTVAVYALYRDRASLPRTGLLRTARFIWGVVGHVGAFARGGSARGQWVRYSSFLAGEMFESARRRVWHLG
jgi:glycosyltransferase involved in cell wall biosynthesis